MKTKYNAQKIEYDGHKFDSQAEMKRYIVLRQYQKEGRIKDLRCHPRFELLEKQKVNILYEKSGRWHFNTSERGIDYTGDFSYTENGIPVVEEVKSKATAKRADYILRRKLFKAKYPEILFREIIM